MSLIFWRKKKSSSVGKVSGFSRRTLRRVCPSTGSWISEAKLATPARFRSELTCVSVMFLTVMSATSFFFAMPFRLSGVSSAMILPWFMMPTLSHIWETSSM